jgi:replication factor C small subunit
MLSVRFGRFIPAAGHDSAMSEAAAEDTGREIWIEKYRPQALEEVVGHEAITERLSNYIDKQDLPHLLFAGPAGTGKCLTGETPVLTTRGLEQIEDVVGDSDGLSAADDGLEVVTFDESGTFDLAAPSHVFGKEAEELVRVSTRDGGESTVTPEHRLLTLDEDGLSWTQARHLDPGDRVVRPRETPLPEEDADIDWLSALDGDRIFVHVSDAFAKRHDIPATENHVGHKKAVFEGIRSGETDEAIAERTDIPLKTVRSYRRQATDAELDAVSTTCSLSYLRSLDADRRTLREHVDAIQYVAPNNRRSRPVEPPWELSPDLARLVGLALSEARIEDARIKFYNDDAGLLDQFTEAARGTFGVDPERGTQKGVPYRAVRNRTVVHYLRQCFAVLDDSPTIGSRTVRAPPDARRAFLRAVFDAEGHVQNGGILELTQKDGRVITLLSYLLAGEGVPSRRKTEQKAATNGSGTQREYHTLYVSGAAALSRFEKRVGFSIGRKADRLSADAARSGNPNHDTMPAQSAVEELCDELYLPKGELLTETLDPETPGREDHLEDVDRTMEAATERIETAQEVLEVVTRLAPEIERTEALPATWVGERGRLEPVSVRRELEAEVDVRTDRLLEYADGRRTPERQRAGAVLDALDAVEAPPATEQVQAELRAAIERLGVPYSHIAAGTELRGTDVINLLENDDHSLSTTARFGTVAERVREAASGMLSRAVLENLRALEALSADELYFDEVETVERLAESRRVYDLTVPGTRNYVAGAVPTVMHNTTSAIAIAKTIYGDDWRENFLELNASDQRGIDVVRDRIKSFARASFGGYDHRIIFLDEADALCVPPGTEVVTGYPSSPEIKKIEEVAEDGEPIPSVDFETNKIQSDKGKLVDSGVADFFEVELADGRTVVASLTHPFFVVGDDGKLVETELQELTPGDEIADFKEDIEVSRCEICGDWTAGRFCSVDCKDEGHSREMRGENNPMYGTEWSEERREKIIEKLADGRFKGENNPNYGGEFHGVSVWEMDEERIEQFRQKISEQRSGTSWDEWVVDADPERVKEEIGHASAEWWENASDEERARVIEKATESCDYPVCDITGDNNPMRDPEVAQKVSEALQGHEPTGGNVRHSDELGHLVRSDWEYEVAKGLQDAGVEYEYEPAFELSDSVYHPDFLIDDTVVEVKGVAELWGQTEKVEEFLDTYGDDYTFVVVGDDELPHHEHYELEAFDPAIVSDGGVQTVETVEIQNIEYSHRGKAYNISMEDTPNFMLANGILTHNTDDAQSALRRTMEQFSDNTRFVLSCNYSSQIIDPIQSRCAVFRFSPLGDEAVEAQVRAIAEAEAIELTDDAVDALVYAADGDMRKAINGLQAAAVMGGTVDEEAVYTITSTARPEEIEAMVTDALAGDFTAARSKLDTLLRDVGIAGGDVVDQIHRSVWEFDLEEEAAVRLMERVGEADYRITAGANEQVQLEALLASLALSE